MKVLYKVISSVLTLAVLASIMVVFLLCLMTPEKTKYGTYTNLYKYWTDDTYLCSNFWCKEK